jgi:ribosomal protein L17
MSIPQVGTAVSKETKVSGKRRLAADLKLSLPSTPGIYLWPNYKGSPLFYSRPLAVCIEETLLHALEEEPLTATKAGSAVKKALKVVSKEKVLKEVKVLLPKLVTSGAVKRVAANRQAVIYLSRSWMAAETAVGVDEKASLKSAILGAIARMQSGPGNYVRVDHLRLAPETRSIFDKIVIDLADKRELVLTRYNGPRPLPDDQKWVFVEDGSGELFIGVALPRNQEA